MILSRLALLFALGLALAACTTTRETTVDYVPPPTPEEISVKKSVGVLQLQSQLGMNRAPADLGFSEKLFNPCNFGLPGDGCNERVMNVVHFQLMCRDTEGTVSEVPVALRPIVSPYITWSVGAQSGVTKTDRSGYGQFTFISGNTVKDRRLILRKGAHYVGLTVSEITKVVLPKNWCGRT